MRRLGSFMQFTHCGQWPITRFAAHLQFTLIGWWPGRIFEYFIGFTQCEKGSVKRLEILMQLTKGNQTF